MVIYCIHLSTKHKSAWIDFLRAVIYEGKISPVLGLMWARTFPSNLNCLLLATLFIECPSALYIPRPPIFRSAWVCGRGRHRAVNYWHFNVPFAAHSYTWDNLITQSRNLTQPYIFRRPCCHQLLLLLTETESPSFLFPSLFFFSTSLKIYYLDWWWHHLERDLGCGHRGLFLHYREAVSPLSLADH